MNTSARRRSKLEPRQLLLDGLAMRRENYYTEFKNCQDEFTEDAIHDLRVATRRMLAFIQLLNSVSPHPRLKKLTREFKDQLDEFDDLRDTQVILGELSTLLPELPQLEEFEGHLRARENEMFEDLRKKLRNRDPSKLEERLCKTQQDIAEWGNANLESLILEAVDDSFLTVRQRLGWVDLARSSTIHRVRVAFKSFRYMVEIAHPLVTDFPPEVLKQMDGYQTLMGNIQDTEVFVQTLADFTKDASFPDLDAVHHYYERRHADTISAFVEAMNRVHTFWRPAPDQPFPWE